MFLTSRTEAQLKEAAEAITATGGTAAHLAADVSQEGDVEKIVTAAHKAFGRIDILVNNAGIYGPMKPVTELTVEEWDQVLAVNLRSAFLMMRAVLPEMLERKRGVILNISSVSGKGAFGLGAAYGASKAGMLALTRSVAAEVSFQGIRVNALCPGPVEGTAMWDEVGAGLREALQLSEEQLTESTNSLMLQRRPQTPEEIAATALFLCSDDASVITGQAMNADGGMMFY